MVPVRANRFGARVSFFEKMKKMIYSLLILSFIYGLVSGSPDEDICKGLGYTQKCMRSNDEEDSYETFLYSDDEVLMVCSTKKSFNRCVELYANRNCAVKKYTVFIRNKAEVVVKGKEPRVTYRAGARTRHCNSTVDGHFSTKLFKSYGPVIGAIIVFCNFLVVLIFCYY